MKIEYRQQQDGARGEGEDANIDPNRFHLMIDGKRIARGTIRECSAALCKHVTAEEALKADAVMVHKSGVSVPMRFNKVRASVESLRGDNA
jgi:hypothetical protein